MSSLASLSWNAKHEFQSDKSADNRAQEKQRPTFKIHVNDGKILQAVVVTFQERGQMEL